MMLDEVDDIIIQLPHVSELRQEQGVLLPQPLVVLRQRREVVVAAVGRRVRGQCRWWLIDEPTG